LGEDGEERGGVAREGRREGGRGEFSEKLGDWWKRGVE